MKFTKLVLRIFESRKHCKFYFLNRTMNTGVHDNIWRGAPLSEIIGSQSPWGAPEFPLVAPAFNHAVLYHVPSSGSLAGDRPPKPQHGQDKWDHDFVRMPCSSHSLYPVDDINGETRLKKRWEIIESALWKPIRNSEELANAILSYNTKFKTIWKFRALHKLFNEYLEEEESQYFFDVTLPEICKLALSLPKVIQSPIPLLKQHKNRSVSLSQQQIASLLANAFFCTFPRRNTTKRNSEYATYPHINFNTLYETSGSDSILEKLKCICHYFRRVCTKVPVGVLTFSRRSVTPTQLPVWPQSEHRIASLPLHIDPVSKIEDAAGLIQLDFANKFLGGGVLGHGCVQEEIRFVICPELLVSMLFTEVLRPDEALMMIGCERYSKYTGYGSNFQFAGDYRDDTPLDSSYRRRCAVLAIDALPYSSLVSEYRREMITRELNKAWVGLSFFSDEQDSLQYPGVATGNWGCGAFGGSPQIKSLIQIMACAEARRPMAYYTFGDIELRDDILAVYNLLSRHNVTVGQLYKYIMRFTTTDVRKNQLHAFIHQVLRDEEKQKSEQANLDRMETSVSSEIDRNESVREAIEKEFLNDSPDMFSQEESLIESKTEQINHNEGHNVQKATEVTYDTKCDDEMVATENELFTKQNEIKTNQNDLLEQNSQSEHKIATSTIRASSDNKVSSNQTSRLFDEMQKYDEDNGRLNLSFSNTLARGKGSNSTLNDSDAGMETDDRIQLEMPLDVKKKMSKKITDYFSKKSI